MNNIDKDDLETSGDLCKRIVYENDINDDFETKLDALCEKNVNHNDTVHDNMNNNHHKSISFQISRERMTKMKMPM
eukprot:4266772-Heterocapsa_arctica.AAC.1